MDDIVAALRSHLLEGYEKYHRDIICVTIVDQDGIEKQGLYVRSAKNIVILHESTITIYYKQDIWALRHDNVIYSIYLKYYHIVMTLSLDDVNLLDKLKNKLIYKNEHYILYENIIPLAVMAIILLFIEVFRMTSYMVGSLEMIIFGMFYIVPVSYSHNFKMSKILKIVFIVYLVMLIIATIGQLL